ncbi:MAG: TonB-dependent receptor [Bacteroidota bacterium]|nr:TonB-dependent receptor [Bacteroidota bacterium]
MIKSTGTLSRVAGIKTGLLSLLICLFFAGNIMAQKFEVTGKVTDSSTGETLPGVSVRVAGTTTGTVTDIDGKYKISLPSGSARLEFSYVGYLSESAETKNRSTIDLALRSDSKSLDEVVVIGYGTAKRKDLTGSVSSVTGAELKNMPVATAAEALTGRLAGVQVTTAEGIPGAEITVRVRGGGSITQDNSPLYIIDGFPSDIGLSAVNPADIVSIDVLKDASSTAIYGARGANGVVLVTTKGGKKGRTNVSYDGYYSVKWLAKRMDLLNPYDYVIYQYELQNAYGDASTSFKANYGKWDDLYPTYSKDPRFDWQKICFGGTAPSQVHNININGGSENTQFNVGYTRNDETGILVNTGYTRDLFKMRLDQKVNDNFKFSVNSSYQERKVMGGGTYSSLGGNAKLMNIALYRPTAGLLSDNLASEDYDPVVASSGSTNVLVNPLTMQYAQYRCNFYKNFVVNGGFDYILVKDLTLRVQGGYSYDQTRNDAFDDARTRDAITKGGPFGSVTISENKRINNSDVLNYNLKIDKHSIGLMAGFEYTDTKSQSLTTSNSNYVTDNLGLNSMGLGSVAGIPSSSLAEELILSYFGRASYSYADKYLLNASIRYDGSSKFGSANRFGAFPAVSAAWRINEEQFIKDIDFISNLKFRASYGESGNNRISNYLTYTTLGFSGYGMNNTYNVAAYPTNYANPNLKWETTIDRTIGLDWGLFKGRIGGTVDLYRRTTKDLLLSASVDPNTGFSTQTQNIGKTQNQGIELTLNTVNINTKDFQWRTDFNISFNRNKVLALTSGSDQMFTSSRWSPSSAFNDYLVQVGKPVGQMYGYVYDGWYTPDDFSGYNASSKTFTLKSGVITAPSFLATPQPGDVKLKSLTNSIDANGNPVITTADQKVIGNANPKHFGGINNSFTYKGFDLGIFLNWSYGNDVYNANKYRFVSAYANNQNTLGIMRERFRLVDGDGSKITDLNRLKDINQNAQIFKPNNNIKYVHSWAIEDGSFLRINNITFGYTFDKKMLAKFKINSLRVYTTVYNIYTFTKYTGYDPEVSAIKTNNNLTPGVDYSAFPRNAQFIFGLNLTL